MLFLQHVEKMDKYRKLPVFKKAEEILELAEVIADTLKEDSKSEHFASEIVSNAMIIQVKIAGAEWVGLYSLQMENAVLIKFAVRHMMNAIVFTSMFEMNEEDYVELMREKVEEFRLLFVKWIQGFDKTLDAPDDWAIRYDTSTPEQEKLEELMFDEDRFFDSFDDGNEDPEEDEDDD
jgi:hypothetical protein